MQKPLCNFPNITTEHVIAGRWNDWEKNAIQNKKRSPSLCRKYQVIKKTLNEKSSSIYSSSKLLQCSLSSRTFRGIIYSIIQMQCPLWSNKKDPINSAYQSVGSVTTYSSWFIIVQVLVLPGSQCSPVITLLPLTTCMIVFLTVYYFVSTFQRRLFLNCHFCQTHPDLHSSVYHNNH